MICSSHAVLQLKVVYIFNHFKASNQKPISLFLSIFTLMTCGILALKQLVRGTFTYILHEIGNEISRQETPMRKAVMPNRRLPIALNYLASTVDYRTTDIYSRKNLSSITSHWSGKEPANVDRTRESDGN